MRVKPAIVNEDQYTVLYHPGGDEADLPWLSSIGLLTGSELKVIQRLVKLLVHFRKAALFLKVVTAHLNFWESTKAAVKTAEAA